MQRFSLSRRPDLSRESVEKVDMAAVGAGARAATGSVSSLQGEKRRGIRLVLEDEDDDAVVDMNAWAVAFGVVEEDDVIIPEEKRSGPLPSPLPPPPAQ